MNITTLSKFFSRDRIMKYLEKINGKNINKGINTFNNVMQDFGDSMDKLSKEFGSPKSDSSAKNKKNLEKIWGKSEPKLLVEVKIWSDSTKKESKKQKSNDKINTEKILGKKKKITNQESKNDFGFSMEDVFDL